MIGSVSKGGIAGFACQSAMPWLGRTVGEPGMTPAGESCDGKMVGMHRGASNIYFPTTVSSILLPSYSARVLKLLESAEVRESLEEARGEDGTISPIAFKMVARLKGVDPTQLEDAYNAAMRVEEPGDVVFDGDETEFRWSEYRSLQESRVGADELLTCRPSCIDDYGLVVRENFEKISYVERLTETRVLTGFSRIFPGHRGPELSRRRTRWLPAFRVHGEGIFIVLNRERLDAARESSASRALEVLSRPRGKMRVPLKPTYTLMLLHTLAHLLVKRMSYEAGYGTSSIRERIYSMEEQGDRRMAGILLYTAAGDSDGTLGGLVRLGKPGSLDRLLMSALDDAQWCASDPVCMESKGQGRDSANLAACHACSLLPETSCELQNRFLDRKLVLDYFGL